MAIRFKLETKIIFAVLALIIIAVAVFILANYRKLKNPSSVPQNLAAQVKGAYVPILPRGNCGAGTLPENNDQGCN
jgi:hypothetical protein